MELISSYNLFQINNYFFYLFTSSFHNIFLFYIIPLILVILFYIFKKKLVWLSIFAPILIFFILGGNISNTPYIDILILGMLLIFHFGILGLITFILIRIIDKYVVEKLNLN